MSQHNSDFPISEVTGRPHSKPGQEFVKLVEESRADRELCDYLDSFSVFVANLVLVHRQKSGLTQAELADKADITQESISQIESGFGGAKLEAIDKVFRVLGVKLANSKQDEITVEMLN
ncbi:helix-turn-helix transcriptional regulator [Saccharibacillus sp. CPCC 101409]|uniref:helix-turn-helix domain-containing protein n=1 Tax=Saccharibacillus sp. CPCC 101409 TaxID=3058041 RepID=UPI0026735C4C|nr:helix-turn-helix transcriptional regulator [Saccharibacillus sp. CPCC 101409]MDO3411206.1 helix-turn-helix transcriptional regulator [Saccharibacillus sp. CPCC 101409]